MGGDHTFGKGSVQQVKNADDIGNLGAVKTTVGMFFTAGGLSTQHRGSFIGYSVPKRVFN